MLWVIITRDTWCRQLIAPTGAGWIDEWKRRINRYIYRYRCSNYLPIDNAQTAASHNSNCAQNIIRFVCIASTMRYIGTNVDKTNSNAIKCFNLWQTDDHDDVECHSLDIWYLKISLPHLKFSVHGTHYSPPEWAACSRSRCPSSSLRNSRSTRAPRSVCWRWPPW